MELNPGFPGLRGVDVASPHIALYGAILEQKRLLVRVELAAERRDPTDLTLNLRRIRGEASGFGSDWIPYIKRRDLRLARCDLRYNGLATSTPIPMIRRFLPPLAALLVVIACDRSGGGAPRRSKPTAVNSSSTAPPAAAELPERKAVVTLDAGRQNTAFALVPGKCLQKSCPAEIELRVNGRRLDAVPLQFAASGANLTANPGDASFATNQRVTTYAAGDEEGEVTTFIQTMRLSPQRTGLLVQQSAGFEHVKRRRDLFIVDNDRLKRVWSRQDGSGPVRSYADVLRRSADADELVMIEGSTFAPAESDRVSALSFSWEEQAKSLRSSPVTAMKAVVIGNYAHAEAARARLADTCLSNYWIIAADQVGEAPKRFVLALLVTDTTALTRLANRECSPSDIRRIVEFRPTNESNK